MSIQLSKKDIVLLSQLDGNSRASLTQLAKKGKLSVSNVSYRLAYLGDHQIVEEYYALLNPFAFKKNYERAIFKFRADWPKPEITAYCRSQATIGWFIVFDGSWNFGFQIWSNDAQETNSVLRAFLELFGDYVEEYTLSSVISIEKHEHNFLYDRVLPLTKISPISPVTLDALDKKILLVLFRDSRIKLLDISKKLHVHYKVIDYRIKSLVKRNVILGYKLKLNRFNLGYDYYKITLNFKSHDKKSVMALKEYLRVDNRVMFITQALGWADLEFEIFCKNQQEYRQFQESFRKRFIDIIKQYETLIPLEFDWNHILP